MAYKLVHPRRLLTQRQEFWLRSESPLPTQTIAARRHFIKDTYIQASWRDNEPTLTGLEFFQRSNRDMNVTNFEDFMAGSEGPSTRLMDENISQEVSPISPATPSRARSLEATKQDLAGESTSDESGEEYVAHLLHDNHMEEEGGETSPGIRPIMLPETEFEHSDGVPIPRPNLQAYKNGQFPLTSLKTQYGWNKETYKEVQKRCKELVPTYFNPRLTWIRQKNREQSEGWLCEVVRPNVTILALQVE
ncbi:hypothetical protein V5O48_010897 [Marasmius crinis-equi]|uniref:Uncharacterized protein n=1 Tax=Marasmius crinis-equi TaxID=585013 RepID=A0ABR3F752_9AGAR